MPSMEWQIPAQWLTGTACPGNHTWHHCHGKWQLLPQSGRSCSLDGWRCDQGLQPAQGWTKPMIPQRSECLPKWTFWPWGNLNLPCAIHCAIPHHFRHVTVACNGLSVLKKAQESYSMEPYEVHYYPCHSTPMDYVTSGTFLPTCARSPGLGITMVLPCMAWMNIHIDNKAKNMVPSIDVEDKVIEILHKWWVHFIDSTHIVKHLSSHLWKHLNGAIILQHWVTKHWFAVASAQNMDWAMG